MRVCLVLLLLAVAGVANAQSADYLIRTLGQPSLIMPGPHGNTIFVYVKETSRAAIPYSGVNPTTFVAPGGKAFSANIPQDPSQVRYISLKCTTIYEINRNRQVVSVRQQGSC